MRIARACVAVAMSMGLFAAMQFAPASARESFTYKTTSSASVLRLRVWDQWNLTGAYLAFKGTTSCTATTYDVDQAKATFPSGVSGTDHWDWNDSIWSASDHNACDVKFYEDTNYQASETGWVNFGTAGANVSDKVGNAWDNIISSLRIS